MGLRSIGTLICAAFLAAGRLCAQESPPESSGGVAIPDHIPGMVYDGAGVLSTSIEEQLSGELRQLAELGVNLYAITIADAPDGFPVGIAALRADRWSGGTVPTAVVLRSPGSPPRIDIGVAGLRELPGGEAAMSELHIELNAIRESAVRTDEAFADAVRRTRQAIVTRLFPAAAAAAAPASPAWTAGDMLSLIGIPLLAVAVFVGWLAFRRRGGTARVFPAVEPRRRFSGPHSGGNNAQITYGKQ